MSKPTQKLQLFSTYTYSPDHLAGTFQPNDPTAIIEPTKFANNAGIGTVRGASNNGYAGTDDWTGDTRDRMWQRNQSRTGVTYRAPWGIRLSSTITAQSGTVSVYGGPPKRLTNALAGPGDPRTATDRGPRWSPDGRWILFESGRRGGSSLLVVSPDGNVTSFLTVPRVESGEARWSPDGKSIAYVERSEEHFSGSIRILDFDSASGLPKSAPRTLYTSPVDRGGGWSIRGVEWAPDGTQVAAVLQNSGWDHIYLLPAPGGAPKQITDGAFNDEGPRFSPDGKSIAFTSSRGGILETTNLVDSKRMAIDGISHGATMTLYVLVRYPDLYAAAIEFAGVADRALFNERTNPNSAIRWQMKMGGPAAEKPDVYRRADIIAQVDKIQTPLLVLHGEDDPQVPPANAANLAGGSKASIVVIPNGSVTKPRSQAVLQDQYCGPKSPFAVFPNLPCVVVYTNDRAYT